jgi:hypothetical protein
MRYWEDFTSKYGFSDGEATPPDAKVARSVYVRAINTKAEKLGSNCRVIPYNRPGTHNAWVIVSTNKEFHNKLNGTQRLFGTDRYPEEGETKDDAMAKAIAWAIEQDLDQFICSRITINEKGLGALLESALKSKTTHRRRQKI